MADNEIDDQIVPQKARGESVGILLVKYFFAIVSGAIFFAALGHTSLLNFAEGPLRTVAWCLSYAWPALWYQYVAINSELGAGLAAAYCLFNLFIFVSLVSVMAWVCRGYWNRPVVRVTPQLNFLCLLMAFFIPVFGVIDRPYVLGSPIMRFNLDRFGFFFVRQSFIFFLVMMMLVFSFFVIQKKFTSDYEPASGPPYRPPQE